MAVKNDALSTRETPIAVGDDAPRFTLMNQEREEISLDSLLGQGKDVVLSFYPMDFTSVCTDEMTCFSAEKEKLDHEGATVVGISCDSFATHKAFADAHDIDIPLLADMHRQVCKAYGFYWADLNVASRGTVVLDESGKVKWVSSREPGQAIEVNDLIAAVG